MPQLGSSHDLEAWARQEKRAMMRSARNAARWCWTLEDGRMPLDDLCSGAHLRVLRVLWSEPRTWWPSEIARGARLSRSTVHAALGRLAAWRVVDRYTAWDTHRSYCYRLARRHPLVHEIDGLFRTEARIYWSAVQTGLVRVDPAKRPS